MKIFISGKTQIILIFILLVLITIAISGCSNRLGITEEGIKDIKIEVASLKDDLEKQSEELSDYNILTSNLNKLLSTVYYGSAKPESGEREKNFTAFSMFYKDEFYLITAGHCIEYEDIKYHDFKFKSNTSKYWIYPDLLSYEADYLNNRDYAIFALRNLRTGLIVDDEDGEPKYVLGNFERRLNYFKEFGEAEEGESGSPILSAGCKLVGIVIKNNTDFTPIGEVTNRIDQLISEQEND